MNDLIFVSLEDWDDVWRRNQFLCVGLAKRFPERKILFAGLPRDISHDLRHGRMPRLQPLEDRAVPGYPNIRLTQPLKFLPNAVSAGRRINEGLMRSHIRREARRAGLQDPILWLNPHSAVHMAGQMDEHAVLYDITDDWSEAAPTAAEKQLIAAQDAELCRRADAVIVCSGHLYDLKRRLAKNLHLIANGVDVSHYRTVLNSSEPLPVEAGAWPKPVLGYVGTIHPERVDVALVESLARDFPDGTIVLVGPNFLPLADDTRLRARDNVQLTGPVPYSHVPDVMRAFDVCITPHCQTRFTESLNPIKLWEYLACGKPIVSTNVAGFRDYPHLVSLASTPAEFAAACRDALHEDKKLSTARIVEASKHTWDARLDQVQAVLGEIGHL